jgi:hypothetical protein
MQLRQCECQRFVKTMSFRRRSREGPLVEGFRHILPVDKRPEAALAAE